MSSRKALCALALMTVSCASPEIPTAPLQTTGADWHAASSDDDGTHTFLVRFPSGIPQDFSDRIASLGGEVLFAHAGAGVGAVTGLTDQAAATLVDAGLMVAPDGSVDVAAQVGEVEAAAVELAGTLDSPGNPTTAFFYNRQWGMRAIQADRVWAAGALGASSVRVGILDTGLDYLHPDLYGRVDLTLSKSFLSAAENNRVQALFPGAHPVADLHYHGTHVGSTVASNGIVAAGVTSQTTLVGLKVCVPGTAPTFNGTCAISGVLAAVLYAADIGLPIINMSFGGGFNRRDVADFNGAGASFIETLNATFNYVHEKGTVVFTSSGNSATNMQSDANAYKTYCDVPHAVCVSATGPAASPAHGNYSNVDAFAPYSSYGGRVTVAAPGGAGRNPTAANPVPNLGWVYAACSGFSLPLSPCRTRFYDPVTGAWSASVVGLNGTSMASPHAAGVAALIAARGGNIRSGVISTSDDLGKNGKDPFYGAGRVNAFSAAFGK
jgi:subtilisin family serine protease